MLNTLLIASTSALISFSASASPVQPAVNEEACFAREYSAAHLQSNPQQKLESLLVLVSNTRERFQNVSYDSKNAKVIGVSKGKYYLNEGAGCEYRADGSIRCGVDCDGGAFTLTPQARSVLFQVAENYYFPLFKSGKDQETAGPSDMISLEANDHANAKYKLYPVAPQLCKDALDQAKMGLWGC